MGPDAAKKRGHESKNYSPPIPPTRIPFFQSPDLFFVRFFEFSVFQFFALLDSYWSKPFCRGDDNLASWLPEHVSKHFEQGLLEGIMGSHPTSLSICVWPGRKSIAKESTRCFSAMSHICSDIYFNLLLFTS